MPDQSLTDARSALAECVAVVERLHKMCCDPDRSPRMRAIEESLLAIRPDLASGDSQSLGQALNRLETVGAELGSLQVRCCASVRMPLYAEALASLNTVQLGIATELGLAH